MFIFEQNIILKHVLVGMKKIGNQEVDPQGKIIKKFKLDESKEL